MSEESYCTGGNSDAQLYFIFGIMKRLHLHRGRLEIIIHYNKLHRGHHEIINNLKVRPRALLIMQDTRCTCLSSVEHVRISAFVLRALLHAFLCVT